MRTLADTARRPQPRWVRSQIVTVAFFFALREMVRRDYVEFTQRFKHPGDCLLCHRPLHFGPCEGGVA